MVKARYIMHKSGKHYQIINEYINEFGDRNMVLADYCKDGTICQYLVITGWDKFSKSWQHCNYFPVSLGDAYRKAMAYFITLIDF